MRPVVLLDRDGVLNELVGGPGDPPESPLRTSDVALISGAAAAAVRLADAGFLLACVSNQPAAAKGATSVAELLAVHDRVLELLGREGVRIAAGRLCLHHPDGVVAGLAGICSCRKPAPGMLLDVATELDADLAASWMVGDTDADIGAGRAVGARTLSIENPDSAHKRSGEPRADLRARSLHEGVEDLLAVAELTRHAKP